MPPTTPPPDDIYKHALAHSLTGSGTTPIKKSAQSSNHESPRNIPAQETYRNMATELAGYWVGPMPPEKFTDVFFPPSSAKHLDKPEFSKTYFNSLKQYARETDSYDPIVSIPNL